MLHPATELRVVSPDIGYGVFATAPIPLGTLTWVLDPLDYVLTPERVAQLGPRWEAMLERYSWLTATADRIFCWDFARYMNHSCAANCLGVGPRLEIAIRDIDAGRQLTNDYATLNLERPFRCLCGEPTCRREVSRDDLEPLAVGLDELAAAACRRAGQVTQPLAPWLGESDWFWRVARAEEPVPSVRERRCTMAGPLPGGSGAFDG